MISIPKFWLIGVAAYAILLLSCGDDKQGKEYSFERSLQEPVVEKRCITGSIPSEQDCYLLKWRIPIDAKNLLRVHVWLDTLVVSAEAQDVPSGALEQSTIQEYVPSEGYYFDSLDISSLVAEFSNRDSLPIALWAQYSGSGIPGRIVRTFVILGDDIQPARVQFQDSTNHETMVLRWNRPTDRIDFYQTDSLSGIIPGYDIHLWTDQGVPIGDNVVAVLKLGGVVADTLLYAGQNWRVFSRDSMSLVASSSLNFEKHWAIRDGHGFNLTDSLANVFEMTITGLSPSTQYQINIVAYDQSGNMSISETPVLSTTDPIAPLIPTQVWIRTDTLDPGRVRVDSNRVQVWWLRSVDPLDSSVHITLDTALQIPTNCRENTCWRQVQTYELQVWNGQTWGRLESSVWSGTKSYATRWSRSGDSMVVDPSGPYVSDTLRWMVPGDSLILRLRSVDSSGGVSLWMFDTLQLSRKSFVTDTCPNGYVPVLQSSSVPGERNVYCIERYEHRDSLNQYVRHIFQKDARRSCQELSDDQFNVDLCEESEWRNACATGGSRYGTIEEQPFYPQEFLFRYCNLGSGDSISAYSPLLRDERCVSQSGVYDMPGQLQEWSWMIQKSLDSITGDTLIDTISVLKGSSYVAFNVVDKTVLARCTAKSYPARMRARYIQDSVYLYRNGSYYDTLFTPDTSRTLARLITPSELPDTLLIFEVRHPVTQEVLGEDYVDQKEYRRRGGMDWIEYLSGGLDYVQIRTERVLIMSGEVAAKQTAPYYRDGSIGYRCCARKK